jgi:hypothetical protein
MREAGSARGGDTMMTVEHHEAPVALGHDDRLQRAVCAHADLIVLHAGFVETVERTPKSISASAMGRAW